LSIVWALPGPIHWEEEPMIVSPKPTPGIWTWKASLRERIAAWYWQIGREIVGALLFLAVCAGIALAMYGWLQLVFFQGAP